MDTKFKKDLIKVVVIILLCIIIGFISLWLLIGIVLGLIFGILIGKTVVSNLGQKKIELILNSIQLDTDLAKASLKLLKAKKKDNFWKLRQHYKDRLSELSDETKTDLEISQNNVLREQYKEAFLFLVHLRDWERINSMLDHEENCMEQIRLQEEQEKKVLEEYYANKNKINV